MDDWQPATVDEVKRIIVRDLQDCDALQLATFRRYAVEPHLAPITRNGNNEMVVVVARKGDEVIYYEDIEEGFNLSPINAKGVILEHWCNQDALRFALNAWVEGRENSGRFGPAQPLSDS